MKCTRIKSSITASAALTLRTRGGGYTWYYTTPLSRLDRPRSRSPASTYVVAGETATGPSEETRGAHHTSRARPDRRVIFSAFSFPSFLCIDAARSCPWAPVLWGPSPHTGAPPSSRRAVHQRLHVFLPSGRADSASSPPGSGPPLGYCLSLPHWRGWSPRQSCVRAASNSARQVPGSVPSGEVFSRP